MFENLKGPSSREILMLRIIRGAEITDSKHDYTEFLSVRLNTLSIECHTGDGRTG